MLLVSAIEGNVLPFVERSVFVHSGYNEAEVVNDGFLVFLKHTSALYVVVAPHGENFCGKMVVRVACHFNDKG